MNEPYATTQKIARHVRCEECGSCGVFAVLATRALLKKGFFNFYIVMGFVKVNGTPYDHIWLELDSGEEIDPTIIQFGSGAQYMKRRKRHNPEVFLKKKGFRVDDPKTAPWIRKFLY